MAANSALPLLFAALLVISSCETASRPQSLVGLPDGGALDAIRAAAPLAQVAVNPWALRQRTPVGRRIHTVELLDGQVYVGFGDWRANTGPIDVTSWDVGKGGWVHHYRAGTEAIERFVVLQRGLLLPYTDPQRKADFASGPAWQEHIATTDTREAFAHVFDAAETEAGTFLIGTRRVTGEPLVQLWNGEVWQQSLLLPNRRDWIWFAVILQGQLYIQSEQQGAFRFDGTSWQATESLFASARARSVVSVAGRAASITRSGGAGRLQTSDGVQHTLETAADAWDLNIDQATGWVYLLRGDRLQRSRDLLTWETLPVAVPAGASAIDVADGVAWIGTADSSLWRLVLP